MLPLTAAVCLCALALVSVAAGASSARPRTTSVGNPAAGKAIFLRDDIGCGNCHTLKAADATGTVGPDLDEVKPSYATVVKQVTHGGEYMPAFAGRLTAAQIQDVAAFVATATHGQMPTQPKVVTISTRKLPGLGTVLVNAQGRTLYAFARDKRAKVTCTGACAAVWPPVRLAAGAKLVATGGAKRSLLGSIGGRVVTYAKWPLYTYVADTKPGQAKGQARNLNGGLWYVLGPSGALIRTK